MNGREQGDIEQVSTKKIGGGADCIKKQFNFNKLIDNKPGAFSMEFIQSSNPSSKDRLTNQKVIFAIVVS